MKTDYGYIFFLLCFSSHESSKTYARGGIKKKLQKITPEAKIMGIFRLPTQKTQSRMKFMYKTMYNDYEGYIAWYALSILYTCHKMNMPQRWSCMYTHACESRSAESVRLQEVQALLSLVHTYCAIMYMMCFCRDPNLKIVCARVTRNIEIKLVAWYEYTCLYHLTKTQMVIQSIKLFSSHGKTNKDPLLRDTAPLPHCVRHHFCCHSGC